MGVDLVTATLSIPIIGPDGSQYHAHVDTQATILVAPPSVARQWVTHGGISIQRRQVGLLANNTSFSTTSAVLTDIITEMGDTVPMEFAVSNTPNNIIILGLPALKQLPVTLRYAGRTVFEGCPPVQVVAEKPSHRVGECIHFQHGSPEQQAAVTALLTKYKDNKYVRVVRQVWSVC